MTSRRAPLANVPNAVNSPFRNVTATNGKRTRAQLGDVGQGQPPAKRKVIMLMDEDEENVDPKRRSGVADKLEEPFARRRLTQPTAFERKLAAVREKKAPTQHLQSKQKSHKAQDGENMEAIRQWQSHYRRQFPSFVMYFDGVPEEVRSDTVRTIKSLGAREDKFFSKAVTHVVTTRLIPPELSNTSPDDYVKYVGTLKGGQSNPLSQDQKKTTSLLDGALQRRNQLPAAIHDVDLRRIQTQGADILSRARQLGIKIWGLEKLHRMLSTILDTDPSERAALYGTRSHATASKPAARPTKDTDLEQLLRNEKVNGPADRDMTVAAQDMGTFFGYYIYVHDMDERTRPVMVRDYPKPAPKEPGKWPQFRLTAPGRCPFVEDPAYLKKLAQQEAAAKAQDELAAHNSHAAFAQRTVNCRSAALPRHLTDRQANLRRSPRKLDAKPDTVKLVGPPTKQPATKMQSSAESMPPLFWSAQQSLRGLPRTIGGEPVASGVQPSNVTSAIRSQYVSSAAISSTAPGANHRVGDTKEVSMLKRKVLERGNTGGSVTSNRSMPSSYMNDMRAALNNDDPPPRKAKRKAQDILGVVHEDDENDGERRPSKQPKPTTEDGKPMERDPKPGYCENCRDKFEDFDDHIQSRKHRKFAMTQGNWKELDALLGQLKRPHKVAG